MWNRSIMDTARQARKRGICLYGAGYWGEVAYKLFTKLGVIPLCYCDDNPKKWGKLYQELPVYSVEEAVSRYPGAVYIVCIDSKRRKGDMNRKDLLHMLQTLKDMGVYDSHSELRIYMYVFLLQLDGFGRFQENGCFQGEQRSVVQLDDIQNILIINHMSNSGSNYFEQLLDGHPNIVCFPYISEELAIVYERRLQYLEGEELLIEMTAQMFDYLCSEYIHLSEGCAFMDVYANETGESILTKKLILVEVDEFVEYLKMQFAGVCKLHSLGHMMKIYYAAYNACRGKRKADNVKYWMIYNMHDVDFDIAKINSCFQQCDFKRVETIVIIREPVQQCAAFIRRKAIKRKSDNMFVKGEVFSQTLKSEMGMMLERKPGYDNITAIRFEDLKYYLEQTMKSLCRWMEIPFNNILLSTTLNSTVVYYRTYTKNGTKYITGNDLTAVNWRDFSEVLTLWDEARLNIIYSKFKKAYGYKNDFPEFTEFSDEAKRELLKQDFKFAAIVQELLDERGDKEENYDVNSFVKELYQQYMHNYREDTEYYGYIKPRNISGV